MLWLKIFFYFFRVKIFFEFSYKRRVKTADGWEAMVWKTSDCIMMDMTAGPGNIVTRQAFPSLMSWFYRDLWWRSITYNRTFLHFVHGLPCVTKTHKNTFLSSVEFIALKHLFDVFSLYDLWCIWKCICFILKLLNWTRVYKNQHVNTNANKKQKLILTLKCHLFFMNNQSF